MIKKLFILLVSVGLIQLFAGEYHVDKSGDNLVKFISDAPIEDFEGVTDQIDGYIYWKGDNLLDASQFYFEVDLNTLDTGIGLRNRHMRDNYLETERYPMAQYNGRLVEAEKISDTVYEVKAEGKMFIHGVENQLTVNGKMIKKGDRYQITSAFDVKLSDYHIDIPSIMFYKIDETMALELNFFVELYEKSEDENNK